MRLAREGERRRRVVNVMQLKPFFQDGNGEAEEAPLEDPGEATPGGEPQPEAHVEDCDSDEMSHARALAVVNDSGIPVEEGRTTADGDRRSGRGGTGTPSTMESTAPSTDTTGWCYVEEPPSPPRFPALSESGGAPKSEASREERLVPSPMEVERVEHQVPSLPMEPGVADEWIVEDEEMVNEETADEERVEHQVPSPATELVATDEWVSEDERRVEHPVPSPAMEQVAADEWLVEDEMADGQRVGHPVPSPAMKDVVADE
ncbi:hypothetical protein ACLKA6_013874 [Drosophila palustris]